MDHALTRTRAAVSLAVNVLCGAAIVGYFVAEKTRAALHREARNLAYRSSR